MSARVLVVEDDPVQSRLVEGLLEAEGYHVTLAKTAEEASKSLEESDHDLLILDIGLPDRDGLSFCRELRDRFFLPVIMLTARAGTAETAHGLDVGADDYLTKPFEREELLARVRAQLRRSRDYGGKSRQPTEVKVGDLSLDYGERDVRIGGRRAGLTEREFAVVAYLARHPGMPVARERVFEGVWGVGESLNTNSLDVIVHRIRRKIEKDASCPEYLVTVRGFGYKVTAPALESSS